MTHSDWQAFLGAAGARIDNEQISDFGDLAGELRAARDATVLVPLTHLALIACTGEDASDFLHNQLTSDVRHLADGAAQPAAWCTARGRMLASFFLLRDGSTYTLRLAADLAPAIAKRLRIYVLRSKVKVEEGAAGAERIQLGLAGVQAEAALSGAGLPVPTADLAIAAFASGWVLRLAPGRYEVAVDASAAPATWQALASLARPAGSPVWRWLDIRSGWPLVTAATSEEFVPQMADFDQLGGVSFKKGCYPGQEVIARTHYLGKIKRRLFRLHAATPLVAGLALWSPDSPEHACGMIVDGTPAPDGGFDALAVVQDSSAERASLKVGGVDGADAALSPLAPLAANAST
ncbi:CAF17-like 4Fe-4S cluster assembly/insertion protein YgfZ [Rhodocyclus tenuis]|uniref:Folate-binding protein n=1 Tax=Rhodocyclus tenuis TaxID=1066 RepID=A0A840GCA2_RHOTE|nr:folate-binding protein YgfZ [Rhodocyclus tenuis]MBB4248278.1 hypothetical protein [Rhodocyclus tenuis]